MAGDKAEDGTLSIDEANDLVLEHRGWAESIARSVARAWNLDWQLDGLDGAAMEALIFCARRFKPSLGVPFRGYARKRIHEASTEAARKSKGWQKGLGVKSKDEQVAREISSELFRVFPELREGELPMPEEWSGNPEEDTRSAIRSLLVGANFIAAKHGATSALPDDMVDYKRMVEAVSHLEIVHQMLLWQVYWDGESMRTVASAWGVDELSVIREHKALIEFLAKAFAEVANPGKGKPATPALTKLKVRPALRDVSLRMSKEVRAGPFSRMRSEGNFLNSE